MADERTVQAGGVRLSLNDDGDGPAVVLLHGLTATRRYVVMGSRALERSGHRVVAVDARGHGRSSAAPDPSGYGYGELASDLGAVIDSLGISRAVLAGASMGAHTALRFALDRPERVAGLVVITPAYEPSEVDDPRRLARWDALSDGLRSRGVEGFVAAYGDPGVPAQWKDTVVKVIRQRLALHDDLSAVADALHVVPRSRPFGSIDDLGALGVPAVVVASSDDADPGHPLAVGEAYARAIPGATLVRDEPGKSPVAWQGSQLSKIIASVVSRAEWGSGDSARS